MRCILTASLPRFRGREYVARAARRGGGRARAGTPAGSRDDERTAARTPQPDLTQRCDGITDTFLKLYILPLNCDNSKSDDYAC